MNVERVELTNFGSWAELDLPISPGVSLISGPNGSGKSTILAAVEFGLFGATSDAGRLIRRGTDEAVVRVYLEDGLVVKRAIRRSGTGTKIALSVRRFLDEEDHDNLTAATVSETQAVLDGLLGVSRETLRASAFSMQGDGAAFCEARPADRKRLLMETMPSMALWPVLHEAAKADAKTASDAASLARAELERLDGAEGRLARVVGDLLERGAEFNISTTTLEHCESEATRLAAQAEAARDARRQHAAAVEAQQRAQADHARATQERTAAGEALERARSAAANAPDIHDARTAVRAASDSLEAVESTYRNASQALMQYRSDLDYRRRDAENHARAHHECEVALDGYIKALAEEERKGECSRCGQSLATASTRFFAEAQIESARVDAQAASACLALARDHVRELTENPAPDPDDDALAAARVRAQVARTALAEAETIQSLAGSIEAAETRAREAAEREHETKQILGRAGAQVILADDEVANRAGAETEHQQALVAVSQARAAHSAAAAELARAEEAAKQAEQQALDETTARERLTTAEQEAAIASILVAGFGPSGCPAMIVDSVLGDLADEANRVLAELGSPIRVDLRSQRVTKDGRLVDALEIVALMDAMEAPYETLSGGERTRLALALRAALTRLLASKRGARVRLLVVDEPAGLDSTGCEQLATVLQEFVTAGVFQTVLLVTHQAELAEQIGRVVRIEKSASGESRLADSGPQFPEAPAVSDGSASNGSSSGGDRPAPSGPRMGATNA